MYPSICAYKRNVRETHKCVTFCFAKMTWLGHLFCRLRYVALELHLFAQICVVFLKVVDILKLYVVSFWRVVSTRLFFAF